VLRGAGVAGTGSGHGGRQQRRRGVAVFASDQRQLTVGLRSSAGAAGWWGAKQMTHAYEFTFVTNVVVGL